MEHVMAVTVIARRVGDGRDVRTMNQRSHVGDMTCGTDGGHASKATEWRQPHTHHTPAEVVGLVLWWLVIGALTIGSVIFIIKQP